MAETSAWQIILAESLPIYSMLLTLSQKPGQLSLNLNLILTYVTLITSYLSFPRIEVFLYTLYPPLGMN
jgi:hypothetical protein